MVLTMLTLEEPFDMPSLIGIMAETDACERKRATEEVAEYALQQLGVEAKCFVRALLNVDTVERLGTVGGAAEVRAHPFFATIDWARLVRFELPPPLPAIATKPSEGQVRSPYA